MGGQEAEMPFHTFSFILVSFMFHLVYPLVNCIIGRMVPVRYSAGTKCWLSELCLLWCTILTFCVCVTCKGEVKVKIDWKTGKCSVIHYIAFIILQKHSSCITWPASTRTSSTAVSFSTEIKKMWHVLIYNKISHKVIGNIKLLLISWMQN